MTTGLDTPELLARLLLALVVGMTIGMEREWREKAAGFRTLSLVSLGACIMTMLADYIPGTEHARLAAGVITGVGFLGAGAILRDRGEVLGLTTAASVWVSATLGMAAGIGAYALAVAGALLSLAVLFIPAVRMTRISMDMRVYEVVTLRAADPQYVAEMLRHFGLRVHRHSVSRDETHITSVWRAFGKPKLHAQAAAQLLDDDTVVAIKIT